MSAFINDFRDLLLLTNSQCSSDKPLESPNDLISRLKDFNESCRNNSIYEDLLPFKLRLLGNLMCILGRIQKQDQKCAIISSMTNVIRTSVISDIEFFIQLYNSVFYQIYREQDVKLSEEIKLEVLEFAIELIKRSTRQLFQVLYDEEYAARFSMGVLIAVQMAKEERSIKLRTTSLDFLLYSMQYHRKNDKVLQSIVGKLFMFYLPGVIGRVIDIILRDETQPHLITVKAITCWGQLLYTVMQDVSEEDRKSDAEQIKAWMNLKSRINDADVNLNIKEALQEKTKSKAWLEAAAHTLQPVIMKIQEARKHSHPKVRLELTVQISRLIENCLTTLKTAINLMLEILISSSEDEEIEVREAAEFAIIRFENRCRSNDGQVYLNFIEESLYSLIKRLPNVIHLQDDRAILNGLKILCGYLKILNNSFRFGNVVNFSANLNRLIRVLLMISKLELHSGLCAQDYSVDEDIESPVWEKKWKRFKNFADEKIMGKLTEVCELMGRSEEVETILDYLMSLFTEELSHRNEILLLMNEIVGQCPNIQNNIVRQFLDIYLHPDNLYLPLEVDDEQCFTIQECYSNIITVALLMEGMGKLSMAMGSRFGDHLLRSLYPVIEKMGNRLRVIRTEGRNAAVKISISVGLEGDIRQLIQTNVDYLTYHITVKLRRGHPGVFDVVTVLMKNSPFEAMTNLEEIVRNVLKTSSENFRSAHTVSYLRLFQTFVLCVNKWMGGTSRSINIEKVAETDEKCDLNSFVEYIKEQEKPKEENDDEDDEEKEEKEEKEAEDEECAEEKPKELPKHIQLTISIAESALNYLPSKDLEKKLIVLEILNESVLILANRENELLPLVHKIWSPLVTRFEQVVDPLVINRSFALLYNLSRLSKDFIRRRTLKNVLPTLQHFLLKSAGMSKLRDSGTGYQFTQNFKLQKELLNKLAILAIDLGLSGKELDSITECCLPYLSSLQPIPLQENSRKSLMDFKKYDPYLLWYKLQAIKDEPEYSKNVNIVLDYIMCT